MKKKDNLNKINRREFIKNSALIPTVFSAAALLPNFADSAWKSNGEDYSSIKWDKAPCRFCGTGCGLLIGVSQGRAVAVKGDPDCEVNRGLCCVKGYHAVQSIYGTDRITKAMVRKNGKMVEVPIDEALDIVASKMKETIQTHGPDSTALYGSGQWAIPDGYVASKFMKGCVGTNNLEANARLCMASAVTGFLSSFGADEPMGSYLDIDYANTFILWGNNMAEMHPVLFNRITERKVSDPQIKIIDLATRTTMTSKSSDHSFLFNPQADLAIANAICYEIIKNKWVDNTFVRRHTVFKKGKTNIGYGLEDTFKFNDQVKNISFNEFKNYLNDYTPEKVEKISGLSARDIRFVASLYGDPNKKVVSYWCMGVNQHTRGTWMNNLIYNIHLLVGKISQPGNGPFSLTGQPSACGTVREVGTLTHKLPKGVVSNKEHRKFAAKIWGVPVERISSKPSNHTIDMFRGVDNGKIKFLWVQVTNPMVTLPKLNRYRKGLKKSDRFIVVSDIYPTPTTDVADVILPSAMWIEREGMFGNSERRTQHWNKMIEPPGDSMSDAWQIIEVAKRMGFTKEFPWKYETHIEDIWNEYIQFHAGAKHGMAPYETLQQRSGVVWPFVKGKETKWRFNSITDPAAKEPGFDFYGKPNGKAWIIFRPYEPPPEIPDRNYPFWLNTGRILEHWHTGSMTRRIPILHRSAVSAYVEVNPADARKAGIREGDQVKITSRRGSLTLPATIDGRGNPPPGQVFVPFFDENMLINETTLDGYCPISKQPDYKKCAVKIEKVV